MLLGDKDLSPASHSRAAADEGTVLMSHSRARSQSEPEQEEQAGTGAATGALGRSFDDGVRYCCVLIEFSLCDNK